MTFSTTFEVTQKYTAKELGSGTLAVLGTPGLIAMVENVCMNAVVKKLEKGETTVGSAINIKHLKPSALGALITIKVELKECEKKHFEFDYQAFDGEKLIATGSHSRVIVNSLTFMERTN